MFATVLDRYPTPPCAKLLGLEILDADPEKGWVRLRFEARPEFCNPAGFVQGGILTAMLDDSMGPAVLIHTNGATYPTTISLTVNFLAGARPGPLFAESRIVQLGKTIGYTEAVLADGDGRAIAKASASVRLVAIERALAAA